MKHAQPHRVTVSGEEEGGGGRPFSRFFITVLVVLAILYVAVFLAARTDGFRSYLEERFKNWLGVPVTIKTARVTVALDLVINQLASEGWKQGAGPGFKVERIDVRWSALDALRFGGPLLRGIELRECDLAFEARPGGKWEPDVAKTLGAWVVEWSGLTLRDEEDEGGGRRRERDAGEKEEAGEEAPASKPELKPEFWDSLELVVRDSRMSWKNEDGREMAVAEGIDLDVTPVKLPNRQMVHYFLRMDMTQLAGGRGVRNFSYDMVKTGDSAIILSCTGERVRVEKGKPGHRVREKKGAEELETPEPQEAPAGEEQAPAEPAPQG